MASRQIKAEMAEAKAFGVKSFWSEVACDKCGNGERQTDTGACCKCLEQVSGKMEKEVRADAIFGGHKTYLYKPCSKCGDVNRYVANRCCVTCERARANARYKANPERCKELTRNWRKNNREYIKLYKIAQEELRNERRI